MFLQYAIWGAWAPVLSPYLINDVGFSGGQVGWIYALLPLATIISPFVGGQVANRCFSSERVIGFLAFTGGVLMPTVSAIWGSTSLYRRVETPESRISSIRSRRRPERIASYAGTATSPPCPTPFLRKRGFVTLSFRSARLTTPGWLPYQHASPSGLRLPRCFGPAICSALSNNTTSIVARPITSISSSTASSACSTARTRSPSFSPGS
ncbi:MAG: MFS transporter [Armatimonadota bacterium]